jgi:hypothetical protein
MRDEAKNVADFRLDEFSLSMRRMNANDDHSNCKLYTWKFRDFDNHDSCSKDKSKFEKKRSSHVSRSTTLRLVLDETLFDREKNLLKRMTQMNVKTAIRVMTIRNQMKN